MNPIQLFELKWMEQYEFGSAEQRRRCSYRSVERILCVLVAIATAIFFFEAPPPGYAVVWSGGVSAADAPVTIRRGSRFIASMLSTKPNTADGLPRGRWRSVKMPRQVGSTPHIQFNPIQ